MAFSSDHQNWFSALTNVSQLLLSTNTDPHPSTTPITIERADPQKNNSEPEPSLVLQVWTRRAAAVMTVDGSTGAIQTLVAISTGLRKAAGGRAGSDRAGEVDDLGSWSCVFVSVMFLAEQHLVRGRTHRGLKQKGEWF